MDHNLVEIWLRKDPIRWFSGVLAGLLAGAGAIAVAMAFAAYYGFELTFPLKFIGTILLGPSATEIGGNGAGVVAGAILFESLCAFLGAVFAHFTGTNSLGALLSLGLVWGTFSWIFIWNLFLQSFPQIFAGRIPSGVAFPICLTFGLMLASISFFDPMLRTKK